MFCLCGTQRVSSGANVRPQYSGACGRARGLDKSLPKSRLFRGAYLAARGRSGPGASSYGHVYRASHSLLQVQAAEDARTFGTILVTCQHTQGDLSHVNISLRSILIRSLKNTIFNYSAGTEASNSVILRNFT